MASLATAMLACWLSGQSETNQPTNQHLTHLLHVKKVFFFNVTNVLQVLQDTVGCFCQLPHSHKRLAFSVYMQQDKHLLLALEELQSWQHRRQAM